MSKIRTRGGTSNLVWGRRDCPGTAAYILRSKRLAIWVRGGNTEKGTSNRREQCAKACRNPNEAALKVFSTAGRECLTGTPSWKNTNAWFNEALPLIRYEIPAPICGRYGTVRKEGYWGSYMHILSRCENTGCRIRLVSSTPQFRLDQRGKMTFLAALPLSTLAFHYLHTSA